MKQAGLRVAFVLPMLGIKASIAIAAESPIDKGFPAGLG